MRLLISNKLCIIVAAAAERSILLFIISVQDVNSVTSFTPTFSNKYLTYNIAIAQ